MKEYAEEMPYEGSPLQRTRQLEDRIAELEAELRTEKQQRKENKMDNVKANTTTQANSGGSRLNGKAALRDMIERLRRVADQYETLLREMPEELSEDADEALWRIAIHIPTA